MRPTPRIFIPLLLIFCSFRLNAVETNGYNIVLTPLGNLSGKVTLALQTTEGLVVVDSLPVLRNGALYFTGNQTLEAGQYTFIHNGRRLFNFLISFEKKTDLHFSALIEKDRTTEVAAFGDLENTAYIEFQRFIQDINRKPNLSETDIFRIDNYTDSIARLFPNTILAIIVRNVSTPPLPQYMALHDRRVLHTSILPIRIQSFFTNVVPPQPEWVIPQIDSILNRCTDLVVKEWCGAFMLGYFLSSSIMGMENAAMYLAKKYLNNEITTPDPDLIDELKTYVSFNERSLLGMPAPELLLPDADGRPVSLNAIDANGVILLFYDEDCPICREEMPDIEQVYRQYKSYGIKVYAVYTQDNKEAWRSYIRTLNPEWIHVWDPDFSSNFHKLYNVTGTPRMYLLDKNKIIIGRGLDALLLQQMLSALFD